MAKGVVKEASLSPSAGMVAVDVSYDDLSTSTSHSMIFNHLHIDLALIVGLYGALRA